MATRSVLCPIRQPGVAQLRLGAKRQRLRELEDFHEYAARAIRIDWTLSLSQLKLQPPGGGQARKRARPWLPMAPEVHVDYRAGHARSPGELRLAKSTPTQDLFDHTNMLADSLT